MGLPSGTLRDPTGTIADGQRMAAVSASTAQASNILSASAQGLTNAMERLWAVADRTNDFTGRLYISADLDSDPGYENVEAYRVHESIDTNGTIHYYTHFTRELSVPPKTIWCFEVAPGALYWSEGVTATNNATTNVFGYACYDIAVTRPAGVGNIVLICSKFLKFGAAGTPLDLPSTGLRVIIGGVTNVPFTGSVTYTNSIGAATNEIIEAYESGFLQTVITNSIGGIP